jgi:hypothetical protein
LGAGVVVAAACAVGRLGDDGPWIGFVPALDDGYALVVGRDDAVQAVGTGRAGADDLVALAIAYFADELSEPPESLAATHGDLAALVRAVAAAEVDVTRGRALADAVDAIDDGLAADAVVGRLSRCLSEAEEPVGRLRRRAAELLSKGGA